MAVQTLQKTLKLADVFYELHASLDYADAILHLRAIQLELATRTGGIIFDRPGVAAARTVCEALAAAARDVQVRTDVVLQIIFELAVMAAAIGNDALLESVTRVQTGLEFAKRYFDELRIVSDDLSLFRRTVEVYIGREHMGMD